VDDADNVTSFSSRGPTADGRVKPDIVFPGDGIVAAQADGTALGSVVEPGYVRLWNLRRTPTPREVGAATCLLLTRKPSAKRRRISLILRCQARLKHRRRLPAAWSRSCSW
jgi:serine protease AprX